MQKIYFGIIGVINSNIVFKDEKLVFCLINFCGLPHVKALFVEEQ